MWRWAANLSRIELVRVLLLAGCALTSHVSQKAAGCDSTHSTGHEPNERMRRSDVPAHQSRHAIVRLGTFRGVQCCADHARASGKIACSRKAYRHGAQGQALAVSLKVRMRRGFLLTLRRFACSSRDKYGLG
eukprot:2949698-Pleurochrysis_carterae.AAC.1